MARKKLEGLVWKAGPQCAHCGEKDRLRLLRGQSHRSGLYKCNACRRQFTVTVGTVFHRSHLTLDKWFLAIHLLHVKKPPASIRDVEAWLGVTYRTAWLLAQRLREGGIDGVGDFEQIILRLCGVDI